MKRQIANVIYILQNLAVPIVVFFLVSRNLAPIAYAVVLVSKWRIVAVGPHFWLPNLRSNACDIIVGLSTVALMSSAPVSQTDIINPLLTILYAVWLLFIKPRSGTAIVAAQAFIAQFYGLLCLYLLLDHSISSGFSWIVILVSWIIGRSAARHFLSIYPDYEAKSVIISLWGFLVVQLAWVFWMWNVIYVLPMNLFAIPLMALLTSVLGYVAAAFFSHSQRNLISTQFIVQQGVFLTAIIGLVLLFTNWTGQI
jgi:hypothetical protein